MMALLRGADVAGRRSVPAAQRGTGHRPEPRCSSSWGPLPRLGIAGSATATWSPMPSTWLRCWRICTGMTDISSPYAAATVFHGQSGHPARPRQGPAHGPADGRHRRQTIITWQWRWWVADRPAVRRIPCGCGTTFEQATIMAAASSIWRTERRRRTVAARAAWLRGNAYDDETVADRRPGGADYAFDRAGLGLFLPRRQRGLAIGQHVNTTVVVLLLLLIPSLGLRRVDGALAGVVRAPPARWYHLCWSCSWRCQ